MRAATCAILALLGLCVYAEEEGELVRPKLRLPGERSYANFALTDADLQGVDAAEVPAVKEKIKSLNDERAALKTKLQAARDKVLAAQQDLNQVLAQLDQQDTAFVQYLTTKLGADRGKEFAVRLQLQPVIDWLDLDADKAKQLLAKQLQLIELVDLRRQIAEQARAAAAGAVPKSEDERKAKIALLKKYSDLNKQWITNIREAAASDPEKLKKFELRYRRTRYVLEGGEGGGAAPAPAPAPAPEK
jgi:electron transfer flavoprotein alpha subunit